MHPSAARSQASKVPSTAFKAQAQGKLFSHSILHPQFQTLIRAMTQSKRERHSLLWKRKEKKMISLERSQPKLSKRSKDRWTNRTTRRKCHTCARAWNTKDQWLPLTELDLVRISSLSQTMFIHATPTTVSPEQLMESSTVTEEEVWTSWEIKFSVLCSKLRLHKNDSYFAPKIKGISMYFSFAN